LMYISQGEYKTSHFAISTGLMALGLMIPGAISGAIQQALGYPLFFLLVCLLTIPGMITIFFIPLALESENKGS
ncbi:MAG: MFS transporter, partial [Dolichospermum sp.]